MIIWVFKKDGRDKTKLDDRFCSVTTFLVHCEKSRSVRGTASFAADSVD